MAARRRQGGRGLSDTSGGSPLTPSDPVRDDALARAADLAVARRACPEAERIAGGWVLRHRALAASYRLNALHLTDPLGPATDAGELAALAERWQGELSHRHVAVDDEHSAARIAPALEACGWARSRLRFMALGGESARRAGARAHDPRAVELDEHDQRVLERAVFAEDNFGPEASAGLPELLSAAQAAIRVATPARRFAASQDGEPVSMCTLLCDDDVLGRRVALIEQVATLRRYRERGLARAAVGAALCAAADWGADVVAVGVDAEDWPQLMYASLGFTALGERVAFTRSDPGVGGRRAG